MEKRQILNWTWYRSGVITFDSVKHLKGDIPIGVGRLAGGSVVAVGSPLF